MSRGHALELTAAQRAALEADANGRLPEKSDLFRVLTVDDLADLPEPAWLIDRLLVARGLNVLYGPSGGGKTFLALDWSLCIAAGRAWYGRPATAGAVLFIAAEGAGGLHRRVAAWQQARQQHHVARIRFLPNAVNLLEPTDVDRARRTIDTLSEPPALVVIDTLARCMVGGDENAARDVGLFIDNVDTLRRDTGAGTLVVHHTGKTGDDERGSSALRGAADLMAALRPDGANYRLECTKAKDAEPFDPWTLHLDEAAESCVLRLGSNHGALGDDERRILETLPAAFGSERPSSSKLLKASGVAERTYYRAVQSLQDRGYIEPEKVGRSVLYGLTDEGRTALLPTPAEACQAGDRITAATATPLGVAGGSHPGSDRQPELGDGGTG